MSVWVKEMPTLHGHPRKRSSLEDRDTSNEVLHHTVAKPTTVKNPQSPNRSEYIEIVLTEVATTVLTARPCDWRTSIGAPVKSGGSQQHQGNDGNGAWHGETTAVFLSKDLVALYLSDVKRLWRSKNTVCIEVYGRCKSGTDLAGSSTSLTAGPSSTQAPPSSTQAPPSSSKGPPQSSLLLELWCVQVSTRRDVAVAPPTNMTTPSDATPTSAKPMTSAAPVSPRFLLQAVQSHLHFSQIRSWQEVGMSDHTHSPFQLAYNVCVGSQGSDMAARFFDTLAAPILHTFPLLSIAGNAYLQVMVWSLPRLHSIPQQLHPHSVLFASMIRSNSEPSSQESFPFSPPTPSPLSPKLLSGLADKLTSESSLSVGAGGTSQGWSHGAKLLPVLPSASSETQVKGEGQTALYEDFCEGVASEIKGYSVAAPQGACGTQVAWSPLSQVDSLASGLSSLRLGHSQTNRVQLPTFEAAPRAPGSPIPFSTAAYDDVTTAKRRSCALSCKRVSIRPVKRVQRCNSAPVNVSSLCLLGTFEESILNGRLEACGYVEGFEAELAASGSFCPPHLTLPVTAAFYSLHDNYRGTSPYLGQVDLSSVGRRGYQVPRKGTVQVTLFNPNHTVVKIYIIPYNFSDMPPCSQTFLRQKTLSYPSPSWSSASSTITERPGSAPFLPSLHYLIHLRFLCSKSRRLYLHRDIRMIFARRAPDTEPGDSHVTLHTVTDGPDEPKYSPTVPGS